MSLFELIFALSSVVLGIALANMAASLHRLALAGRRIRWAPEPLLLATLITLIIVQVWLDQWYMRDLKAVAIAAVYLTVIRLMTLYFAAASVLPEPDLLGTGDFDLKKYYYDTRALTYGAMIGGLWLFSLTHFINGERRFEDHWLGVLVGPALYGLLIWSRRRWLHFLVLLLVLGLWGSETLLRTIKD